jgi:Fe-S cluster assembly protein SufD
MARLHGGRGIHGPRVSRLHEHQSYELADFPVPTGREEEWRFTPLRRLRGLHTDSPSAGGKVSEEADAAPGLRAEEG